MSKFLTDLKGNFLFLTTKAIDKKVDGREITHNLDEILDAKAGPKASEKIQRGPIFNLLCEMQEGLFEENPPSLVVAWRQKADELEERIIKEKEKFGGSH